MATTEIQRVPGTFNLPSNWPRVEIPDVETGILVSWDASSLELGALPVSGWIASNGSAGPLAAVSGTNVPLVAKDAMGKKFVRLNKTRLRSYVEINGDTTVLMVLRTAPHEGNRVRILTGNNGYRGLYLTASGFVADIARTPDSSSAILPAIPNPASIMAVAGRFSSSKVDIAAYGKGWSPEMSNTSLSRQTEITVGSSSINPPGDDTYLTADLYAIHIWNRHLSKTDVEAALRNSAISYQFV